MEGFEIAADLENGSSPTRVMINPVLAPAQWAQMEFALVPLGDPRRTQRLVKPATRLAESPGGTLPQALPHWEELKAADRFLSRPENTREQILRPQGERTLAACSEPGEYLLIEDTTLLDYSPHRATTGLGVVGDGGRGLCLHSTLAMKVTAWDLAQKPAAAVVGLLGQQCWAQNHHVADLHLVREAAKGDDAQLLHRPRQVADDEAASGAPERFAFRQGANVAQAFGHDAQAWAKYQCS